MKKQEFKFILILIKQFHLCSLYYLFLFYYEEKV